MPANFLPEPKKGEPVFRTARALGEQRPSRIGAIWKLAAPQTEFIMAPAIRVAGVPRESYGNRSSGWHQTDDPSVPLDCIGP